jgi:hypothetical protein
MDTLPCLAPNNAQTARLRGLAGEIPMGSDLAP